MDKKFSSTSDSFILMLDQHQEHVEHVIAASQTMFSEDGVRTLLEPPFQLESHLYQTLQCADWICGLIGRWLTYHFNHDEFNKFDWSEKYFGDRIRAAAPYGLNHKNRRNVGILNHS
ncbi:MAG: DUF3800 domain-containing protein [Magnetococcales bacterium]|nr:DUF3800 domain-containing protein [Magnetococcales bacterium]